MSADHTTTVDRLKQQREAFTSSAADRIEEAQQQDASTRGTLLAGNHVVDLVTGLYGVIQKRTAATPTPFGAFPVKLDTGEIVVRFAIDLFARPTPPRA